jgi:IS605 OrfB family transposase
MLSDALTRNHLAYTKLLTKLLPDIEKFAAEKPGLKREIAIYRSGAPLVKPLPLSLGSKAGLISDVAGQISSYIELRAEQESPSNPTAARLNASATDLRVALTEFANAVDIDSENDSRDRLIAQFRAGMRRPILFLKNRVADGYLVLYSPEKNAYFAWLNLHSQSSRFAKPVKVGGLVDVRTGKAVSFTGKTGALFPLAFARDFQFEEFIAKGRPQSAKLLQKGDNFELHVTFEFSSPRIIPATVMGVDRGIYSLASFCTINGQGVALAESNVDGRGLRYVQRLEERQQKASQKRGKHYKSRARRHMADEAVHVAANQIVAAARVNAAQVVVESLRQLTSTGKRRPRSNFNRLLGRSQYQKLQRVLEYKLAVAGLPKPKEVSAAYTSQTCPCCGFQARENRPKLQDGDGFRVDRFICQRCGYEHDADLNAARLIALKRLWREGLPPAHRARPMSELSEAYSFET